MPHNTTDGYVEAWRRVCAAYDQENRYTDQQVLNLISNLKILYGDPNAPKPQGVIRAQELK